MRNVQRIDVSIFTNGSVSLHTTYTRSMHFRAFRLPIDAQEAAGYLKFPLLDIFVLLTRSNYCDSPDRDRGTCHLANVHGSLAFDTVSN